MFCIRMDVDGILWSFNSDESQPVVHTTTFDAFGYVEASKNEKKFVTCSSDFKYVAIVETTRRAYIYWQLPKNGEGFKNLEGDQKSIGSSSETSKQCLITLRHQGANCEGDNEFDTNNIIGVYAGKCAFYLLTSKDLFAFVFDYNENQ
uniref:NudC domain-containing protein 1 n=1 Tax=Syphacia muris TaxID=451379 RepID=A0A0N5AY39_9BILA